MSNRKVVVNVKTLYFEGAGWEKAERSINTIGNCRVRTAFHLDNGKGVYLEIVCGEMLGERNSRILLPAGAIRRQEVPLYTMTKATRQSFT